MAKFLTNIDLRQNQLKNAVIEQLTAAPANAKAGQVYFNTTTAKFCVCVDATEQKWESFPSLEALASAVSELEGKIALKADQTALEQAISDLEDKIDAKDHLPEQTDNAGKVLTTDGTDASWDYVINMNNVTEGTTSGLSKLVINKLTKAEYEALEAAGQIKDTELYITDAEAYTKEEVDASVEGINAAIALKADKTELASEIQRVEGVVATKADQSTLTSEIARVEGVVATKADQSTLTSAVSTLEGQIALKADKATFESEIQRVDGAIALKADQATTYTKTEVDGLFEQKQDELDGHLEVINGHISDLQDNKADKTTVESEIERIEGVIENLDCLPAQADNAGKFLTTNGTSASWGALPEATAALKGIVKLASADEVTAGTSTSAVVTVAQMTEKLNAVSGGAAGAVATLEEKVDQHIQDTTDALALKADQTALESAVEELEGSISDLDDAKADKSTLESEIQRVEGVVATKADKTTFESEVQRIDAAIALKADQTALEGAVQTLEGQIATKADKATTLAGYGIKDAYTQEQIDDALALKANTKDVYTKEEVDAKVSSVYKFKGSVATVEDLPTEGNVEGDVYNVQSTGENYAWVAATESEEGHWDDLGGDIDLTPYLTIADAAATYETIANVSALANRLDTKDGELQAAIDTKVATTDYEAKVQELEQAIANTGSAAAHKITAQNTELVPASGVAAWTIAHTMGSDVEVVVKEVATNEVVYTDVVLNSNEVVIKINSDETIAADTYRVIIMG